MALGSARGTAEITKEKDKEKIVAIDIAHILRVEVAQAAETGYEGDQGQNDKK